MYDSNPRRDPPTLRTLRRRPIHQSDPEYRCSKDKHCNCFGGISFCGVSFFVFPGYSPYMRRKTAVVILIPIVDDYEKIWNSD